MNDYVLFVDTEASGLPVNWTLPYSTEGNWPSAVQISWLVYTKDGQEIKRENHYIRNTDFFITPKAIEIHGINSGFLAVKGEDRKHVLELLTQDLKQYEPLVVGHFVQFDYHVLSADFYRASLPNPLTNLPVFCTMLATTQLAWTPMPKSLLLGDLYAFLFYKPLENQHDALCDAKATADCFFELLKRTEITEKMIAQQDAHPSIRKLRVLSGNLLTLVMPVFILLLIMILAHTL
ncbi:3'-5' exonuclease [Mucilaginibacter robiniae]|uniref:3'-5' exonuclease n=1 Tax=Mucilaginibacter robiniae TaxID=2728022 RepID=A0A7L5DY08_9SPHI|nr:3'-5' exonuclease [Mucilaginibacter robiniae]QJD94919.1 3'-5' exonuclease [Mucilaginibacter robiniae]